MSNTTKSIHYKQESDEEARKPFLENKQSRSTLDSTSEEPNDSQDRKFSKRKRVFILSVAAISVVVVVVVVVALTEGRTFFGLNAGISSTDNDRKLSLDDVRGPKYMYDMYIAEWVSDNSYLRIDMSSGVLGEYKIRTTASADAPTEITTILTPEESGYARVQSISPDREWFLFANNTRKLYRRSFYADFYIKNLKTKKLTKLRTPNDDEEQIRYARWSTVGNALVFVHKCNIYYVPNVKERTKYFQITTDGKPNNVFNGVPDWVYEEEIIASTHALEFSSDGKYMSYVTFNASMVPYYRFPKYGPQSNMYPEIEKIAYPKAGFPNPTIEITVVDVNKTVNQKYAPRNHLIPPKEISNGDYYYAVMKFNGKDRIFIQWMNRAQNKSICMFYGMTNPNGYVVEEHDVQHGWVDDDYTKPLFAKDGSYYITLLANPVPGKGDFRHLAKVACDDPNVKNVVKFLTEGAFVVHDINCWNPEEAVVYFRSTEVSPRDRHVYSYNLITKEKKCVSCGLIKDSHNNYCTYHRASFSTKCSSMVLHCQGPFLPVSVMYHLKSGKMTVLTANNDTAARLEDKDLPETVFYTVKSDGYDIPVKETRPKNMNKNKKHVVLFDVYGGPNTQLVTSKWKKVRFDTFFVTSYDFILVEIDSRGSGYYGNDFLYAVYRNLGYFESRDAIAVAKELQTRTYVDPDKIAIWGWSYGGFNSATTLAVAGGVINTAVAVAPVTDWRYYDTVYSERYMGIPSADDNLEGYQKTSVMYRANKFRGKNFMLIHGTLDDNVHFQNSAQLAASLIKAGVNFRSQFYSDRDHNIESRSHVYYLISDYLITKLTGHPYPKSTYFGYGGSFRK